ncbi:MAG: hypothetical protein ABGY96_00275 [bacterium]|nr:hypothetical protein [Gammaproteobacteria bacterium]HIL96995.1 hypothetical protein [Pseudomonadales bacterium]
MLKLQIGYIVIALLLSTAGVTVGAKAEVSKQITSDEVQKLISRAEDIHAQAKEKQNGWVMTNQLIADAVEVLRNGDPERAHTLALRAVKVATASMDQAIRESKSWMMRLPDHEAGK